MTDDIRCPVCCRRDPADGRTICDTCLARLDDDLARILELTTLAAGWITATRQSGGNGAARPVPGSRPPLDLATLDAVLGNDVLPVLESWVRLIRDEAGLTAYGRATEGRNVTVGLLVPWLRSWLPWTAERPDYPIDDYAREIRDLRIALERLDPDHERPDGMNVPCPAPHRDHDGRACGYRLTVVMDRAADDIVCPRCSETWSGNRLILVALNDPTITVWAYPADICTTFDVKPATLRKWHARGHVNRHGNRYDVGQAYRLKMGGHVA